MAEPEQFLFDYKEIVTALIKEQGLKEGIWALYVEFGITAANMGFADPGMTDVELHDPPTNVLPTAIIPIKKMGLVRSTHLSSISVDASTVRSKPKRPESKKTSKK